MMEELIVLGATGSIGKQCLDILKYSFDYVLVGVSLNSKTDVLESYLPYFDHLRYVAICDPVVAESFHRKHPSYVVLSGENCNVELVRMAKEASVFNSLMGNVGLAPSLEALKSDRDLFLSNKESIVIGSSLLKEVLKTSKGKLYPVDSEHVGLAKLLSKAQKMGIDRSSIDKLIITASGGALRNMPKESLASVTPKQVLLHPTWSMGGKITVDSATMVNKGYEKIEASFLFDWPLERIDAVICRESLVHALLSYRKDEKTHYLYEYSPCDMKVAISYALSKGKLEAHANSKEDEEAIRRLHFQKIDPDFYPLFATTVDTYRRYGNVGMILYNFVDTKAIQAFLDGRLSFLGIKKALTLCTARLSAIKENLTLSGLSSLEKKLSAIADTIVQETMD